MGESHIVSARMAVMPIPVTVTNPRSHASWFAPGARDALHEHDGRQCPPNVEKAPACEHRTAQQPCRPRHVRSSPASRSKQQNNAEEASHPRHGMEEAVLDHVVFHGNEIRRRRYARQHVVPLKDLVKKDAVDEPPSPTPSTSPALTSGRIRMDGLMPQCDCAPMGTFVVRRTWCSSP